MIKKLSIKDLKGNTTTMSSFDLSLSTKLLKGNNLEFLDESSNKVYIKKGMINLNTKEVIGKEKVILGIILI